LKNKYILLATRDIKRFMTNLTTRKNM